MRKLVHLQMARAVAASAVVIDHSVDAQVTHGMIDASWQPLGWFAGWIGVTSFFVISGLIMMRTSGDEFGYARASGRFITRRILRVVPLYWLATLIYLALRIKLGGGFDLPALLKSLFFIPYLVHQAVTMRPIVGQGWTLDYEMAFYCIFALCLLLPRRIGLPILLASLPVTALAGIVLHPGGAYTDALTPLQFWTDSIVLFFGCGMAIGWAEQRNLLRVRFSHALLISLSLLGLAVALFWALHVSFPMPYWAQLVLGVLPVAAVLMCTLAKADTSASLGGRTLEFAGDASYSTYLFHPLAMAGLIAAFGHLPAPLRSPLLFLVVAVIVCNLFGAAIYVSLERPITLSLRRVTHSRTPTTAFLGSEQQVKDEIGEVKPAAGKAAS